VDTVSEPFSPHHVPAQTTPGPSNVALIFFVSIFC
jgi:hypothetical protein